jgi:hypothetical protein
MTFEGRVRRRKSERGWGDLERSKLRSIVGRKFEERNVVSESSRGVGIFHRCLRLDELPKVTVDCGLEVLVSFSDIFRPSAERRVALPFSVSGTNSAMCVD